MEQNTSHICVCVCTYKRVELLLRLLAELERQETTGSFTFSVVVVDNDANCSARDAVTRFQQRRDLDVRYLVEPVQNIAVARNSAVENATGDLIAIIDDDEFPDRRWLANMYRALDESGADGVLGPVRPHFEPNCPRWIPRSGICERKPHPDLAVLAAGDTSTANVLIRRSIFGDPGHRFDPGFGRTGGSDVCFFRSMMAKGYRFIWCGDGVVYETVPPERWGASFYLKKAMRKGGLNGAYVRTQTLQGRRFALEFAAACLYTLAFPFFSLLGKHYLMKYLAKAAYHVAWVSGYFGVVLIRFRDD